MSKLAGSWQPVDHEDAAKIKDSQFRFDGKD